MTLMKVQDNTGGRGRATYGSNSSLVLMADLLAIVLSLFVMLFAMKVIDSQKWCDLVEGAGGTYAEAPDVNANWPIVRQPEILKKAPVTEDIPARSSQGLRELQIVLMNRMEASGLDRDVSIEIEGVSLKMKMSTQSFFMGRTADVSRQGSIILAQLSEHMADVVSEIRVVNHTSSASVDDNTGYMDLYALSLARAATFAGGINMRAPGLKVEAIGHANRQFGEFQRDKSIQERYDRSERIEIYILANQVR